MGVTEALLTDFQLGHRIADLLCQLFWRQNVYTHRNAKHDPKRSKHSRTGESVNRNSVTTSPGPVRTSPPSSLVSCATSTTQRRSSVPALNATAEISTLSERRYARAPEPTKGITKIGAKDGDEIVPSARPLRDQERTFDQSATETPSIWDQWPTLERDPDAITSNLNDRPMSKETDVRPESPMKTKVFRPKMRPYRIVVLKYKQHRGRVIAVDYTSYDASHARKDNETISTRSHASKNLIDNQQGDGLTSTPTKKHFEGPDTPRRTSKRKRVTRNRPDVLLPEELDAILDEDEEPVTKHGASVTTSVTSPSKSSYPAVSSALLDILLSKQRITSNPLPASTEVRISNPVNHTLEKAEKVPGELDKSDTQPAVVVVQPQSEIASHLVKIPCSSESNKPAVTSKPLVGVRFWIIKARTPRYNCEKWIDGKLQGKPLDSILEEVSKITQSRRIKELKITLETVDMERTYRITSTAVDEFEEMKLQFSADMSAAFKKNRNEFKDFHIWIEPVDMEGSAQDGDAEVEDAVMGDW